MIFKKQVNLRKFNKHNNHTAEKTDPNILPLIWTCFECQNENPSRSLSDPIIGHPKYFEEVLNLSFKKKIIMNIN